MVQCTKDVVSKIKTHRNFDKNHTYITFEHNL